jgi:hypothetical protein
MRFESAVTAVMEKVGGYHRLPRGSLQGWGQELALTFLSVLLSRVKAQQAQFNKIQSPWLHGRQCIYGKNFCECSLTL